MCLLTVKAAEKMANPGDVFMLGFIFFNIWTVSMLFFFFFYLQEAETR